MVLATATATTPRKSSIDETNNYFEKLSAGIAERSQEDALQAAQKIEEYYSSTQEGQKFVKLFGHINPWLFRAQTKQEDNHETMDTASDMQRFIRGNNASIVQALGKANRIEQQTQIEGTETHQKTAHQL